MKIDWCKVFGHKWRIVYVGQYDKWKLISAYCERCGFGHRELNDFVNTTPHDFASYTEEYFLTGAKK
jgi:hypothetical protein